MTSRVIGVLTGLFAGGVFDFLYINAKWSPSSLRLMFAIHVAIAIVLVAVAARLIRLHGWRFAESLLLGIAASIALCWTLIVCVATGGI